MQASYIQRASLATEPGAKHKVTFTNLSSQEANPGNLLSFFQSQTSATQPMPFAHPDIVVPEQEIQARLSEENTNVSKVSRRDRLDEFYEQNVYTTKTDMRTPNQQAWNVPLDLTEARATEMF